MKKKITTAELFSKAKVGVGATVHCGSDAYGYYIATVDLKTKTIGLYSPKARFKHDWTEGNMETDAFDPNQKPTKFVQVFRGSWYELDEDRNRSPWRKMNLHIGYC